ncbi:MAG: hypothetical protein U0871_28500 [Gemmataceae bacterium]
MLVTRSDQGAFAAVLDAVVNPGRKVVLFDPCSPLFRLGAASRQAGVRWVPRPSTTAGWRSTRTGCPGQPRATLLALADPGNPLGRHVHRRRPRPHRLGGRRVGRARLSGRVVFPVSGRRAVEATGLAERRTLVAGSSPRGTASGRSASAG